MSIVSACLPLLQEENATLTSGKQEDGATMRGQCGVSAPMELMSQVNSCSVLWLLYGWITPPRNTNMYRFLDKSVLQQAAAQSAPFLFLSS